MQSIESVEAVDVYDQELSIRVANGAGFISAVALALNEAAVSVRELTLRTPTLDDVFLSVTGAHLQEDEVAEQMGIA